MAACGSNSDGIAFAIETQRICKMPLDVAGSNSDGIAFAIETTLFDDRPDVSFSSNSDGIAFAIETGSAAYHGRDCQTLQQ